MAAASLGGAKLITQKQLAKILELHQAGLNISALSARFGISRTHIHKLLHRGGGKRMARDRARQRLRTSSRGAPADLMFNGPAFLSDEVAERMNRQTKSRPCASCLSRGRKVPATRILPSSGNGTGRGRCERCYLNHLDPLALREESDR